MSILFNRLMCNTCYLTNIAYSLLLYNSKWGQIKTRRTRLFMWYSYHVYKFKTLIIDCSASLLPALPDFLARALDHHYFRKSNPKRQTPEPRIIAIILSYLALFLAHFAPFLMSHNIHSTTSYQNTLIYNHIINAIYPHAGIIEVYHMLYYRHSAGMCSYLYINNLSVAT